MVAFQLTGMKVKSGNIKQVSAAEAITVGQAVTTGGEACDASDAGKLLFAGFATNNADVGGIVAYAGAGAVLETTESVTNLRSYCMKTAGQIDLEENLASGESYIILGYTNNDGDLVVGARTSGISKP